MEVVFPQAVEIEPRVEVGYLIDDPFLSRFQVQLHIDSLQGLDLR